eukprot:1614511-Ditylum_brightwellii.AAC.1
MELIPAARLYLWMKANGDHTCKGGENIFSLTQTLTVWKPPQYRLLGCFGYGALHGENKAYPTAKVEHWMKTF